MNYFSRDYFFGHKKSNYRNYYNMDSDRYWEPVINAIKKHTIRGRMLDVGCAFGFLLKRAKPYFKEIYGLDISEFAISEARKQIPSAELKILDIEKENILYPDNFFDLITAIDVLEHTGSFEQSFKKLIPKLKNKGYLIIIVPLIDTWAGRIWHWLLDKDRSHASILAQKEIYNIISREKMEIVDKNYFYNTAYFRINGLPVSMKLVLKKK